MLTMDLCRQYFPNISGINKWLEKNALEPEKVEKIEIKANDSIPFHCYAFVHFLQQYKWISWRIKKNIAIYIIVEKLWL